VPSIDLVLSAQSRPADADPPARTADSERTAARDQPAPDQGEIAAVWRLLRHLGVADRDADDATQQVFLVVTERGSAIRSGKRRAFVYGTALRVAQAFTRRSARHMLELDEDAIGELGVAGADELLDRQKARQMLDELLAQMPFELRAVFVLFEIEDLSSAEIGEVLGLRKGTVASRLRRAREDYAARVARLRVRLTRLGAEP
jgi:RNA polymerase sigma-70 factor, ECF subfamily